MLNPKFVIRGLAVIVALVLLGVGLRVLGIDQESGAELIDKWVRDRGLTGEALFVLAAGLATAFALPRQLVAFLGGYAFGLAAGTLLALAGAALGCALTFMFARWVARDWVSRHLPARIRKADAFFLEHTFSMTLLIRLLPAGSNFLTNLAAGVSSARFPLFLAGSAVGYIPQMVVFALLGSGINLDPALRISASVVLFFVSAGLGIYLFRRFRHGRTFDRAVDEAVEADETKAEDKPAA